MNRRTAVSMLFFLPAAIQAQLEDLEGLLKEGRQLLQDNVDEDILAALPEIDDAQLRGMLRKIATEFQGQYVLDLDEIKDFARNALTLLDSHEETLPFANWLRPRLDYFDVVDQLIQELPKPATTEAPKKLPNPSPQKQRQAWQKVMEKRPRSEKIPELVAPLKAILVRQGVPADLVWLAEVESAFNPLARSPAGAAGLFQLMPATAKSLGLALSPNDERLNPEKCAAAAARYLKYLHGKFRHWELSVAAYNAGEGRVRNVMDRAKGRTFDDIATRLPAETQLYVPKVDATIQAREHIKLARLPAPW